MDLKARIGRVAADRQSGASEILRDVIDILRDARRAQLDMNEIAGAVRSAQPAMASVWNAVAAALRGELDRFAMRVARAPAAVARFAAPLLETGVPPGAPLRIVTVSYSGTVVQVIEHLARVREVHVCCAEGRPALEGRRLARHLAAAGVRVVCYADAALDQGLDSASAVLTGADAIAAGWFSNKCGTRMLAAAAALRGVPLYVVATRDKFVSAAVADRLVLREGEPWEVWADPPEAVTVRNPYFERVPLDLVSAVVSDVGVLRGVDVAEVCGSTE